MAVELNEPAFADARNLVRDGTGRTLLGPTG